MKDAPAGILEQLLASNATLVRQVTVLRDLVRRIDESERLPQAWYTLTDCAALKGCSVSSLRQPWRQPLGGRGRLQVAGLWRWHRDVVMEWLLQDDRTLFGLYARKPKEKGAA